MYGALQDRVVPDCRTRRHGAGAGTQSANQHDAFKGSIALGSYMMQMVAPVPYVQLNAYLGSYPFYLKTAVGAGAEVILGGHMMAYGKNGFEIGEVLDISLLIVPFGTQPKVSYTDLRTPQGEPGYAEIVFPYVGFLVTLKPSNWRWPEGFNTSSDF